MHADFPIENSSQYSWMDLLHIWSKAIRLAPNNYIEAQNWLKTTGRGSADVYL